MNLDTKIIDMQVFAMINGDHILGNDKMTVKIGTTGIKGYTYARCFKNVD